MQPWRTAIADSDDTNLWIRGSDIASLMRRASFAEMLFLLHRSRLPAEVKWVRYQEDPVCCLFGVSFAATAGEDRKVLDAVLEEFRRRAAAL